MYLPACSGVSEEFRCNRPSWTICADDSSFPEKTREHINAHLLLDARWTQPFRDMAIKELVTLAWWEKIS